MDEKVPVIDDKELKDIKEKLEKKYHSTTSDDGLVTLEYTGSGEYKKLTINKNLDEADKEKLEKDIVGLIEYAAKQIQADFTQIILEMPIDNDDSFEDEDDDDFDDDELDLPDEYGDGLEDYSDDDMGGDF